MIKHIIREIAPEACDFSTYFDGDTFTGSGDDYGNNLFILQRYRYRLDGYNIDEYKRIQEQANDIINGFEDVRTPGNAYNWTGYRSYKDAMEDNGITYNPRKCHQFKQWAKDADSDSPEAIAEYLTITTGKRWATSSVHGYSQGDYAEMVYCIERNGEAAQAAGEIWLGAAKEFCVIDLDINNVECDPVYGYIVADCKAHTDEDYKSVLCNWADLEPDETRLEMIDSATTCTIYSYRTA